MRYLVPRLILLGVLAAIGFTPSASAQPDYTLFESGPVRPIALSPDGDRVFILNTPDGYLEIFSITGDSVRHETSVSVGLEPVAVAVRNSNEVWVVNHLSDSVSVVDVGADPPRVARTLLVGDEPRDIVFAGPDGNRAFIATAHRGQNTPYPDGEYDVPGIGRADVWVFDATSLGSSLGGNPLTILTHFGDRPRALAATPDGSRVYAAVFRSGNQTTALHDGLVCDIGESTPCDIAGTTYPGAPPEPWSNIDGTIGAEIGVMVGFDDASGQWRDELGRDWSDAVPYSIPDLDVFEIDALASVPSELGSVAHVGTVLFNMIVNPVTGDVYVTNTDANNRVRFEGLGAYADPGALGPKPSGDPASVRGNIHQARVTVLDATGDSSVTPATEFNVLPRHLNKHIPYGAAPVPSGVKEKSVATPLGMAVSDDGGTLYVAGFGSNAVAVYDTAELEGDTFVPDSASHIFVFEQPSGLALDDANDRLYVATRSRLVVLDTTNHGTLVQKFLFNPEPPTLVKGRRLLYNAMLTSSNGEASCSSCHIFGDTDDLAWDLGNPDGSPLANPNPPPPAVAGVAVPQPFDPLKGPMTTQSLRGLKFSGPMHWRGDRTGPECTSNPSNPACANRAFNEFNVAFPGLIGRDEGELDVDDMQFFTDFALAITYPPNPTRALDNSLTPEQQAGFDLFTGPNTDFASNCVGCHQLDRDVGFFGTGGGTTDLKVPHLRNVYQKVGMFGQMPSGVLRDASGVFTGDQVRATGVRHDGAIDRVSTFLTSVGFTTNSAQDSILEAFVMAFETDLAPIVGQQMTLTDVSGPDADARITLLIERAQSDFVMPRGINTKECDLIVKGVVDGEPRGWVYLGDDQFRPDKASEPSWSRADLEAEVSAEQPLTFTCVPPGSGARMGINRDRDLYLDADDSIPDRLEGFEDCRAGPRTPARATWSVFLLLVLGWMTRRLAMGRRAR